MKNPNTPPLKFSDIKAVILDMDGVLVDTEPLHVEAFRQYMDGLGLNYDEKYIHGFIGFSIARNVQTINETFFIGNEIDVEKGVRERDSIYLDLLRREKLKPLQGITELMEYCIGNKIKLALASSSSREQVDIILDSLARNPESGSALRGQLCSIVSGDDVANRKPAPDIYSQTLLNLELPGPACLAIEDSPAGVSSAKAAGVNCLALRNVFTPDEKLSGADLLIDSINETLQLLKGL